MPGYVENHGDVGGCSSPEPSRVTPARNRMIGSTEQKAQNGVNREMRNMKSDEDLRHNRPESAQRSNPISRERRVIVSGSDGDVIESEDQVRRD
jgi:hypothetical protein